MYVPDGYRNTKDFFSFVLTKAPEFKNPPTKYALTLDGVMGSLAEAVRRVAAKTQKPEALELFALCSQQVAETHRLYASGARDEAVRLIQVAEATFAAAGKASRTRGKANEEWAEKR